MIDEAILENEESVSSIPKRYGGIERMLIDAREAALLCGISRSAWYKAVSSGKAPPPVKILSSARWLLDEVKAWIMARCPPYSKWKIEREGKWDK